MFAVISYFGGAVNEQGETMLSDVGEIESCMFRCFTQAGQLTHCIVDLHFTMAAGSAQDRARPGTAEARQLVRVGCVRLPEARIWCSQFTTRYLCNYHARRMAGSPPQGGKSPRPV